MTNLSIRDEQGEDIAQRYKALKEARKIILDTTNPIILYKFSSGRWSWASWNSPIHAQLEATGEIYPGVPATRWMKVEI